MKIRELMIALGGSPGIFPIFDNGPATLPLEYQFALDVNPVNNDAYGNKSTTEYFAEVFSWAVYDSSRMDPNVFVIFSELLRTTW